MRKDKELWSKSFPDGFSPDWYMGYGQDFAKHIRFGDLEGKGHTSVLSLTPPVALCGLRPSTLLEEGACCKGHEVVVPFVISGLGHKHRGEFGWVLQ
jgi:hypothetical protein